MTTKEQTQPKLSLWERYPKLKEIPEGGFPRHVLIIPDGNRRYARESNEDPILGHRKGAQVTFDLLNDLSELPIDIVTVWGFSADNWQRPEEEVQGLMFLLELSIQDNLQSLIEKGSRFVHLGRKDRIPESLRLTMERAEELTKKNKGQTLCLAIDFGGSDQDVRIAQKIRNLSPEIEITPELLKSLRDAEGEIPPADLLIRTSGEKRTSDVGWLNGANTELYFLDKKFPETNTEDIVVALVDFSKRQRRMGA